LFHVPDRIWNNRTVKNFKIDFFEWGLLSGQQAFTRWDSTAAVVVWHQIHQAQSAHNHDMQPIIAVSLSISSVACSPHFKIFIFWCSRSDLEHLEQF
jgi:hypothetical protein